VADVSVLDLTAAGIILVSPDGNLRVMASSSEEMRVLELLELFATLRGHARNHNLKLGVVAASVIEGTLPVTAVDRAPR
jgi:hypothetical protein